MKAGLPVGYTAMARRALVAAAGLVFGGAQLLRGAHYPSHTLWSAWLCWLIHVVAARLPQPRQLLLQTA